MPSDPSAAVIAGTWARRHAAATARGDAGYPDPDSGLFVLTAGFLANRGTCCRAPSVVGDVSCRHAGRHAGHPVRYVARGVADRRVRSCVNRPRPAEAPSTPGGRCLRGAPGWGNGPPVTDELEPRTVPSRPVRTGQALAGGVTARELAGPLWQRFHHGVHVDALLDRSDPDLRIAAAAAVLPAGAAIGGWAALRVLGARELDGRAGPGGSMLLPVTVCVGRSGRIRPRPGILLDRSRLDDGDLSEADGLTVTAGTRSCVDVALREPVELAVGMLDVAGRSGVARLERVRDRVLGTTRRRGLLRARVAVTLADGRSKSVPESVLKVVWVLEAGLTRPLVNRTLVDEDGFALGEPDLLDLEAALVAEYDGATHRELRSHTGDNAREEAFEDHNLTVVRATSLDLWPRRPQLVRRLLAGRARGLARDRSRDRFWLRAA